MTPGQLEAVRAQAREAAKAEMARNPPAPLSQWPAETTAALRSLLYAGTGETQDEACTERAALKDFRPAGSAAGRGRRGRTLAQRDYR